MIYIAVVANKVIMVTAIGHAIPARAGLIATASGQIARLGGGTIFARQVFAPIFRASFFFNHLRAAGIATANPIRTRTGSAVANVVVQHAIAISPSYLATIADSTFVLFATDSASAEIPARAEFCCAFILAINRLARAITAYLIVTHLTFYHRGAISSAILRPITASRSAATGGMLVVAIG